MSDEGLSQDGILRAGESVVDGEYEVDRFIAGGNSGEVYRLSHPRHGKNRVLKLFVPFYELRQAQFGQGERGDLTRQIIEDAKNQPYQQREYRFLSSLDHPFIVKVHDFGVETLSADQTARLRNVTKAKSAGTVTLPFIVAAYVDGLALQEGVARLDRQGVLRVIRSVAEALDYLHTEHALLHLDVKSANVRVRPDGYPVLLDFALSQDLSPEALQSDEQVRGGIDWDLTPFRKGTSGVANFIQKVQSEGMSKQAFKDEAFPGIDLYQFGLMLHGCMPTIFAVLTPAEQRYLHLLVDDLLNWSRVRTYEPGQLFERVRRIDATQFFLAIRPGSMSGGKEMPLSNGRAVFVPPNLVPVVDHPELTRLNRLNQLSLLPARFSGATHSRYEHSLDVMRLAQSAARRLLDDPVCRSLFDEKDVEAFITAALLHDINHLPLTHLYQESGLEVLKGQDLFSDSLKQQHPGQPNLGETVADSVGTTSERIHRLIEGSWEEQATEADQVISSVLNSGVDLDKLSYLRLDSERSGLGFASGIDSEALLRAMVVVEWEKRDANGSFLAKGMHVAFPEEALNLIESLAMARSRAFEQLYWCDDNRAMMAQFLACARAISQAEHGTTRLAELMLEVRAETDFTVLRRLDELAEEVVGRTWNLSRLFDTIGGAKPILIYSASDPWARVRVLTPAERISFEEKLREQLLGILPCVTQGPDTLMVDVPLRELDLGGEVLVIDRGGVVHRATDRSEVLRAQLARLGALTKQVRIFAPPQAQREWQAALGDHTTEELEQQVGRAIESALGRSTLR